MKGKNIQLIEFNVQDTMLYLVVSPDYKSRIVWKELQC